MNRVEFKEEVLQSSICPNNFEEIFNEYCHFQNEAIKTLVEFHRICEMHCVKYQLAYGSLLGAIRDNGQIPWDYDIDVFVPYNEKERLIGAIMKDLSSDFYCYCPEIDKNCRHFMMRLAPKEHKTNLLHVDVFYVIGAPFEKKELVAFESKIQRYFYWRYYKLVKLVELRSLRSKCKTLLMKLLLSFITMEHINKEMKRLCEKYEMSKSNTCISIQGVYRNKAFDTEKLWDTMLLDTEVGTFRITKNYNYVLSFIYGDYRKIFPLHERLNEMLLHYKGLTGKEVDWGCMRTKGRYYMKNNN